MKSLFYSLIIVLACNSVSEQSNTQRNKSSMLNRPLELVSMPEQSDNVPDKIDKTLKLKWSDVLVGADEDDLSKKSLPLFENGVLFPGLISDFAYDALSGKRLYYATASDRESINKKVSDSLIYFYNSQKVVVLNLFTGKKIYEYRQKTVTSFATQPVLLKSNVFPIIEKNIIKLHSITDGNQIGSYQSLSSVSGNFLLTKDYLLFSNNEGIYFMDHYGNISDSLMVGKVVSQMILNNDTIYCFTRGEGLLAIEMDSHNIAWQVKTDWYGASIALDKNTVFANHGSLTAFNRKDGRKIWSTLNDFAATQLVKYDNYLLGYISGYSNIDIIGAANIFNGNLEMLGWKNTQAFQIKKLAELPEGTTDFESDPDAAPVFNFSHPYMDLIFGQYDNLICGFEILK